MSSHNQEMRIIIGIGRVPDEPAKPNRILIALIGLIAGLGAAFGYRTDQRLLRQYG